MLIEPSRVYVIITNSNEDTGEKVTEELELQGYCYETLIIIEIPCSALYHTRNTVEL